MLCTNTARAGLALALGMALALGGAAAVAAVPHQALAKVPAKVTGVTASGASTSSVKVSWKKVSGVTGYQVKIGTKKTCLLYTSPSPRDNDKSRMPSSA